MGGKESIKGLWQEWQGLFWVTSWFWINVTLSICNKSVFQFTKFNYPLTLSICHLSFVSVASFVFIFLGWVRIPEKGEDIPTKQLWPLSLLFWCNIAVGNLSLQLTSLALSQVVRSIIPGITMVLSYFILDKRYSVPLSVSVVIVIVGVMVTTYADVEVTVFGLAALLAGSGLAAAKVVVTNKFLTGGNKLDPIYLLSRLAPVSVLQMTVYGLLTGEFCKVRKDWATVGGTNTALLIGFTSFMSFFINYTNFMTNKTTSPLTLTVAGNLKQITTIGLAIVIFNTALTAANSSGILITVCGTAMYSYLSYLDKKKKQKEQAEEKTAVQPKDQPTAVIINMTPEKQSNPLAGTSSPSVAVAIPK
eukprot:TRINITY_DN67865_c10_g2_i1.p1 TRINITY_DN67865_c10_g2~~TRINITY_DN67865_c10_g2_i1.p1  ORF type:complete len:376 (-),score=19.95 TRINITY_DN67865_c10_g2_i1:895-1980(-)